MCAVISACKKQLPEVGLCHFSFRPIRRCLLSQEMIFFIHTLIIEKYQVCPRLLPGNHRLFQYIRL